VQFQFPIDMRSEINIDRNIDRDMYVYMHVDFVFTVTSYSRQHFVFVFLSDIYLLISVVKVLQLTFFTSNSVAFFYNFDFQTSIQHERTYDAKSKKENHKNSTNFNTSTSNLQKIYFKYQTIDLSR
jgi:hypothetical protein